MEDDTDKPATTPLEIVAEAKKRFQQASAAYSSTRVLAVADTQFAMGDSDNKYQWPKEIHNERINGARVCLTVNATAQHCGQVINAIRQNRPTCKVTPSDNLGHPETANIMAGLIRQIQRQNAADDAHDLAAEHAVYGGEGYWRIVTDYEDETSFKQVIGILPCPNPQMVLIDPNCKLIDKSDAEWGFVFEDITREQCKRDHPNIDPESWGPEAQRTGWSDKLTVRRAEYFYVTYVKDTAYLLADGQTVLKSQVPDGVELVEGVDYVKSRETQRKQWKWCKLLGGEDRPIDETDWPGAYLPIISVVGKEINVNGEIIRKGLVRDIKDPQRMLNYAYSETVQTLALQNKIPYMAAAEAISGYEEIWKTANLENRAYLPFNAYDDEGNPLPRPERQPPPVLPAAQIQLLQLSTEEMRAASGQQNSNFGIKSEASSGIGIQRLKVQGEMATFHFPDNLARALRYEAKVLLDLIPKIYDVEQVVNIIGVDGKQERAVLNPGFQSAYAGTDAEDVRHIFNPNIGRYDVAIDTGPAYQTQRQEAFDRLSDMAARSPALMQIAGDIILGAADFPMSDKLAERLEKTLPPQLQDKKPGQVEIPPQVEQQMQLMSQQMEHMGQALEEAHRQLEAAKTGNQVAQQKTMLDAYLREKEALAKAQQAEADARLAIEKAQLEAQTKIQVATMEIAAEHEIAELKGYVELKKQRMAAPSAAMTGDVEGDFDAPAKKTRKRIAIQAPSGHVYQGVIEDEEIEPPPADVEMPVEQEGIEQEGTT